MQNLSYFVNPIIPFLKTKIYIYKEIYTLYIFLKEQRNTHNIYGYVYIYMEKYILEKISIINYLRGNDTLAPRHYRNTD